MPECIPSAGHVGPGRWDLPAAGRRAHAPHLLALIGLSVVSLAYRLVFPEAHLMLKLNLVHLFESAGKVIAFAICCWLSGGLNGGREHDTAPLQSIDPALRSTLRWRHLGPALRA